MIVTACCWTVGATAKMREYGRCCRTPRSPARAEWCGSAPQAHGVCWAHPVRSSRRWGHAAGRLATGTFRAARAAPSRSACVLITPSAPEEQVSMYGGFRQRDRGQPFHDVSNSAIPASDEDSCAREVDWPNQGWLGSTSALTAGSPACRPSLLLPAVSRIKERSSSHTPGTVKGARLPYTSHRSISMLTP